MTGLGRPSPHSQNLPAVPRALPVSQPWGSFKDPTVIISGVFRVDFVLQPPLLLPWVHPISCQPVCRVLAFFCRGEGPLLCHSPFLVSVFPRSFGSNSLCVLLSSYLSPPTPAGPPYADSPDGFIQGRVEPPIPEMLERKTLVELSFQ
jgi:hypothetical protein